MKSISKIFGLILTLAVAFSSCGDDDKTEKSFDGICKHNLVFGNIDKDNTTTTPESTSDLNTMLSDYTFIAPITSGVLNLSEVTSVKITGLKNGVTLKNFSLTINDSKKDFGDIDTDKTMLYNSSTVDYFKDTFNKMVAQKKIRVKATFTPSENIVATDNVKVEIVFNGRFTYWQ